MARSIDQHPIFAATRTNPDNRDHLALLVKTPIGHTNQRIPFGNEPAVVVTDKRIDPAMIRGCIELKAECRRRIATIRNLVDGSPDQPLIDLGLSNALHSPENVLAAAAADWKFESDEGRLRRLPPGSFGQLALRIGPLNPDRHRLPSAGCWHRLGRRFPEDPQVEAAAPWRTSIVSDG